MAPSIIWALRASVRLSVPLPVFVHPCAARTPPQKVVLALTSRRALSFASRHRRHADNQADAHLRPRRKLHAPLSPHPRALSERPTDRATDERRPKLACAARGGEHLRPPNRTTKSEQRERERNKKKKVGGSHRSGVQSGVDHN